MEEGEEGNNDRIFTIKIVLLGNGSCGKTSIISRYCQESFGEAYLQTIGLDFFLKRLDLPDGSHATLQIWDIGGQSIGGKMINTYLENADCVLFVYDITDRDSFESIMDWHSVCEKAFAGKPKKAIHGLVGNKTDLEHQRAVSTEQHMELVKEQSWLSFQTSAKNTKNIDIMFRSIVAMMTGVEVTQNEYDQTKTKVFAASIKQPKSEQRAMVQMPHKRTLHKKIEKSSFCIIS
eukprot:m.50342 g.50342  ORF g.50342 m.50342 type:complete len:234 (-) comp7506_c0_seq2:265-966(-)